jgi:hypothetical protein
MFTHEWVENTFGEAEWLGAGLFGEAWRIVFEGIPATLKVTNSEAEKFCVEKIRHIQEADVEYNQFFPFPYVYFSGLLPELDYDVDQYEAAEEWSPLREPTYFYIREYAEPLVSLGVEIDLETTPGSQPYRPSGRPLENSDRSRGILFDLANKIYLAYGLVFMDIRPANWGWVRRGEDEVLVPIDLACGTREHWWIQCDDYGNLNVKAPFDAPDWLQG